MLFWIWAAAIIASIWLYCRAVYSKFEKAGVKNRRTFPIFGNMASSALKMEHISNMILRNYFEYPNERFVGHYEFMSPLIYVKDLDLIKKITIKDFDSFTDHRTFTSIEPLFSRNLFSLKGDEWRDMRSTLSPAFTSAKIKHMVPFMVEIGDQMIVAIKKKIRESKVGYIDDEIKDLATRYTNDVIASCAFGLKIDSMKDENNQFYLRGKEATTFSFKQFWKFFLFLSFPRLMSLLKVNLFGDEVRKFFMSLVTGVMKDREENNIVRPDMIQMLMDVKKGNLKLDKNDLSEDAGFATVEESDVGYKKHNREWSDIDLIAQAVLFFIAGFDPVSSSMMFLLMEVAMNQDIQEKLVKEIRETEAKNGGKFDYRSVQDMVYLDMVVSEALRLWPPAIQTDRSCNYSYNLGKPNEDSEKDYILKPGEVIAIPTFAIHRDPNFYPNPDKFDPERFSVENRHNIKPFTYMPFGVGPRNCIGSRFALCEVKVMVYQLLKDIKVEPCSKTVIPIVLDVDSFNPRIKGGHWLRLSIRD